MSPINGDGSGRSGDKVRIAGTSGAGILSYQSAGAFQEPTLVVLSSVGGNGAEVGGNGVPFFLAAPDNSNIDDGVGGKGFCAACGCGGTALINDVNDLTGLSIPSSDEDDVLACINGDDRKWPPASWLRFIIPCSPPRSRAAAVGTEEAIQLRS